MADHTFFGWILPEQMQLVIYCRHCREFHHDGVSQNWAIPSLAHRIAHCADAGQGGPNGYHIYISGFAPNAIVRAARSKARHPKMTSDLLAAFAAAEEAMLEKA